MKRQISAQYGHTLQQAAVWAISTLSREMEIAAACNFAVEYTFDFHGLEFPLTKESTAEHLVRQVTAEMIFRAMAYENIAPLPTAFTREQGGKMGEHLYEAVPSAIQCGQRWGNRAYDESKTDSLRHAFEFNGIKVPFNPWKEGEAERVIREVEVKMRQCETPISYYVTC